MTKHMKLADIEEYLKDLRATRAIYNQLFIYSLQNRSISKEPSFKTMRIEILKSLTSEKNELREHKISKAVTAVKNKLLDDRFFTWIDSKEKTLFAWGAIYPSFRS